MATSFLRETKHLLPTQEKNTKKCVPSRMIIRRRHSECAEATCFVLVRWHNKCSHTYHITVGGCIDLHCVATTAGLVGAGIDGEEVLAAARNGMDRMGRRKCVMHIHIAHRRLAKYCFYLFCPVRHFPTKQNARKIDSFRNNLDFFLLVYACDDRHDDFFSPPPPRWRRRSHNLRFISLFPHSRPIIRTEKKEGRKETTFVFPFSLPPFSSPYRTTTDIHRRRFRHARTDFSPHRPQLAGRKWEREIGE